MSKRVEKFAQLVPVQDTKFGVNARQLHKALQVQSRFNDWIKKRIEKYGFIEGSDFYSNFSKTSEQGGRPALEYQITTGMAKELCMVENNELGRKARRYFIYCEEQLKQQKQGEQQITEITDREQLKKLCRDYLEVCEKQEKLEIEIGNVTRQRDEIGNNFGAGPEYYKVSEIPWLYAMFKRGFEKYLHRRIGQMLAAICKAQGTQPKKCQHENGGHWWRAYPKQVIELLHQQLLADPYLLQNLRISKRKSVPQNKCRCINFK